MSVLKFKGPDGTWQNIGTIVGPPGTSKKLTVNLPLSGWSSSKTQKISDTHLKKDGFCYIISPVEANFDEYAEAGVRAKDVTVDGEMTFIYKVKPTKDLKVNILISGVN